MSDNYLELSDEDFLKAPMPTASEAAEESTLTKTVETDEESDDIKSTTETTDDQSAADTEDTDAGEDTEGAGTASEEATNTQSTEGAEAPKTEGESNSEEKSVDYKAEYEKLFKPFKANGRDFSIDSIDDAIQLMQMGANYNKKMLALKPSMKSLKLLEKHNLLGEDKLSYLIDLANKNPEAITKLIKDSGIDPLTIDTETADGYKPNIQSVSDNELSLDEVISNIEHTETFQKTVDVVTRQWDEASRQAFMKEPKALEALNSHMANGIYDRIMSVVDRERTLGRLVGVSDLDAYRQVGDFIQSRNGFADLVGQPNTPNQRSGTGSPNPQQGQEDKLKDKRKALAPTKAAKTTQVAEDLNPLAMSDEDFEKRFNGKFLK